MQRAVRELRDMSEHFTPREHGMLRGRGMLREHRGVHTALS